MFPAYHHRTAERVSSGPPGCAPREASGRVCGSVTVSHFQRAVPRIAHYLIVLALALVTLAVSLPRGNPVLQTPSSPWWW